MELYRRANSALKPDHVVLTFHNNDFQMTPVARYENGQLQLYFSDGNRRPALFRHSALYRYLCLNRASRELRSEEVEASLRELRELTRVDGARLSVVLLPPIAPRQEWSEAEVESRQKSLQILERLELPTYDLLNSLTQALEQDLEIQETPGDRWHPAPELGLHFARTLQAEGLLAPSLLEQGDAELGPSIATGISFLWIWTKSRHIRKYS